jgi:hypothetical protein
MTDTTTTHRHGCTRPGWLLERSHSIARVSIARCVGCGAVELRTEAPPTTTHLVVHHPTPRKATDAS